MMGREGDRDGRGVLVPEGMTSCMGSESSQSPKPPSGSGVVLGGVLWLLGVGVGVVTRGGGVVGGS